MASSAQICARTNVPSTSSTQAAIHPAWLREVEPCRTTIAWTMPRPESACATNRRPAQMRQTVRAG
jgi:hypothetical protein